LRFRVDPWAVEYGASIETDLAPSEATVEVATERAAGDWAVVAPSESSADRVLFVDGVRRVDARVWIEGPEAEVRPGICGTYAAGAVLSTGKRASFMGALVRRGVFSSSASTDAIQTCHGTYEPRSVAGLSDEDLWRALHERMARAEVEIAERYRSEDAELLVVDGSLRNREHLRGAVGLIKSHAVAYLPDELNRIVNTLSSGERTPIFTIGTSWSRHSWYLRLTDGADAPWEGVVRCEVSADLAPIEAAVLADRASATIPKFASEPHKDPRAPQNLYPIGGLERELRRRLGDAALMYRALRSAAASI